jgi:hypothetical protein
MVEINIAIAKINITLVNLCLSSVKNHSADLNVKGASDKINDRDG